LRNKRKADPDSDPDAELTSCFVPEFPDNGSPERQSLSGSYGQRPRVYLELKELSVFSHTKSRNHQIPRDKPDQRETVILSAAEL
jgi:hypothetical protein